MTRERRSALEEAVLAAGLVLLVAALFGTYWDDAWHTDYGRDTFFSPPHLVLFGSVAAGGAAVGAWGLLLAREARSPWAPVRRRDFRLALAGVAATLASAPIDEAWHVAFGRDAVLWSPPHLLGLAGVTLFVGGMVLRLSSARTRVGRVGLRIGHAALVAAFATLVFEYDSDVPQFDEILYLPILATAAVASFGLVAATASDRWAAARASALHLALMLAVVGFLAALGHSRPILPLLVLPALAFDVARGRGAGPAWTTLATVGAIGAVYVPYLGWVPGGVPVSAAQALVGLAVAAPVAYGVARAIRGRPRVAAFAALALLLLAAGGARAHDPGQGEHVADARLEVTAVDGRAEVGAEVLDADACARLEPARTVARRAGDEVVGPLEAGADACRFAGAVTLPEDGRWFVYVELVDGAAPREAWSPVVLEDGDGAAARTGSLYAPPERSRSAAEVAAAVLLYLVDALLLVALLATFRSATVAPPRPAT